MALDSDLDTLCSLGWWRTTCDSSSHLTWSANSGAARKTSLARRFSRLGERRSHTCPLPQMDHLLLFDAQLGSCSCALTISKVINPFRSLSHTVSDPLATCTTSPSLHFLQPSSYPDLGTPSLSTLSLELPPSTSDGHYGCSLGESLFHSQMGYDLLPHHYLEHSPLAASALDLSLAPPHWFSPKTSHPVEPKNLMDDPHPQPFRWSSKVSPNANLLAVTMILFTTFFYPYQLSYEHRDLLVVWNVGQGQWVSWIRPNVCNHFDMGGEWRPSSKLIRTLCAHHLNEIYFSHWDWDHIGLLKGSLRDLPNLCVARRPPKNPTKQPKKKRLLESVPTCSNPHSAKMTSIEELHTLFHLTSSSPSNDQSRIFNLNGSVLVTGDSPSRQERIWRHQLSKKNRISHLIAGHHGSRTSNSKELIESLPKLRQVISSARSRRYGHPHPQVRKRLKQAGVSLIQTEKWGNILIDLPPK